MQVLSLGLWEYQVEPIEPLCFQEDREGCLRQAQQLALGLACSGLAGLLYTPPSLAHLPAALGPCPSAPPVRLGTKQCGTSREENESGTSRVEPQPCLI